jgi:hypothetical protein
MALGTGVILSLRARTEVIFSAAMIQYTRFYHHEENTRRIDHKQEQISRL